MPTIMQEKASELPCGEQLSATDIRFSMLIAQSVVPEKHKCFENAWRAMKWLKSLPPSSLERVASSAVYVEGWLCWLNDPLSRPYPHAWLEWEHGKIDLSETSDEARAVRLFPVFHTFPWQMHLEQQEPPPLPSCAVSHGAGLLSHDGCRRAFLAAWMAPKRRGALTADQLMKDGCVAYTKYIAALRRLNRD